MSPDLDREPVDFTRLSALELMSLGDRERVHTALLAWLLGQDSPLAPPTRGRIAAGLAGISPIEVAATTSATEVEKLDVRVDLHGPAPWILAVEGKLKSREHSDQLARYSAVIAKWGHPCQKVLLSLLGDAPGTPGWRAASYAQLASVLRAAGIDTHPDVYARDYLATVERLVKAARLVERDDEARIAFGDEPSADLPHAPGFREYVSRLRLAKALQQAWMTRLAAMSLAITPLPEAWRSEVDETNGAALLNFQRTVGECCVGLQVQHRSLKMFAYPLEASPAAIAASASLLAEMARRFGTTKPPSKTRTQGFSSITVEHAPSGRDLAAWSTVVAVTFDAVVKAT